MGRRTKEERRLRDACKLTDGERAFIKALRRMTAASEKMCARMQAVVIAARKVGERKADDA